MTLPASYWAQIPEVRDWLHRTYSRGLGHGAQLVEAYRRADNVATVDRILTILEEEGWIKRLKYVPTVEQIFFGVGGRPPGKKASHATGYAVEFTWEAVYDCEELMKFLGIGQSAPPAGV